MKFTGEKSRNIEFKRMDAQALEFEDESFDVIISRNLTWNLPHPEMAYKEWLRVLKKGGKLLNFDANWYGYLYDDKKREAYENDRKNVEKGSLDDHYLCTDIDRMEKIAMQVPLSETKRPGWDVKVLEALGAKKKLITTNEDVVNYDFYREENIYVYNGTFDYTSRFFKDPYREVDPSIYEQYSLRNWLTEILK